jgi:hypothetical protein
VRFGFISLPHPIGARGATSMEAFLNMKNVQSEMDAKQKRAPCKVPPMLMELSGYFFQSA